MDTNSKVLKADEKKIKRITEITDKLSGTVGLYARVIFQNKSYGYGDAEDESRLFYPTLGEELQKLVGDVDTVEELFTKNMKKAVLSIIDKKDYDALLQLLAIRTHGLYSNSYMRRSFRSQKAGMYFPILKRCIYEWARWDTYDITLEEALLTGQIPHVGYRDRLTLALYNNDPKTCKIIEDILLSDNNTTVVSYDIINAIITSGNRQFIEILGKLLVAASLQEGLRQAILECMDNGSAETMKYFVKIIIDNEMERFSSAVRALDVWTGLGYESAARPALTKKLFRLAYDVLESPEQRKTYLESGDALECYFALWGEGCYNIYDALYLAQKLYNANEKYKKLVSLYFISNSEHTAISHRMALFCAEERDPEIMAWISRNLYVNRGAIKRWRKGNRSDVFKNEIHPESYEKRVEQFNELEGMLLAIGKKNPQFNESVFPWCSISLSAEPVLDAMLTIAAYDKSPELIDRLHGHVNLMSAWQRSAMYANYYNPPQYPQHMEYMLEGLRDKSVQNREDIVKALLDFELSEGELSQAADILSSKSSSLRKQVITLLKGQTEDKLTPIIASLLEAKEESKIQAGIELLETVKEEYPLLFKAMEGRVNALEEKSLSGQTMILLENLKGAPKQGALYDEGNGFGLYEPSAECYHPENPEALETAVYSLKELESLIHIDKKAVEKVVESMAAVLSENADYEYETDVYSRERRMVLLGDSNYTVYHLAGRYRDDKQYVIDDYPKAEEFKAAAAEYLTDGKKMLSLCSAFMFTNQSENYHIKFSEIYKGLIHENYSLTLKQKHKNLQAITTLFTVMLRSVSGGELFRFALDVYNSLMALMPMSLRYEKVNMRFGYSSLIQHEYLRFWRKAAKRCISTDAQFEEFFNNQWRLYMQTENFFRNEGDAAEQEPHIYNTDFSRIGVTGLELEDICRAIELGILPKEALHREILVGSSRQDDIRTLCQPRRSVVITDKFPWVKEMTETVTERIVEVECRRGELPTKLTSVARNIEKIYGSKHFVALLVALGKEDFHRGYSYNATTKKMVLSKLLKSCYPLAEDNAAELKAALTDAAIPENRMIQAAMYAPQWAPLIEGVTGIKGLKSGIWFFHAHVSERFDAQKETEVAIYSPIAPKDFNDGAFDRDWFMKVHKTLGDKTFDLLYKYAKYTSDTGNYHRRSQLYYDAALGKTPVKELEAEIVAKRNQDKLRCYPLIPMKNKKKETLERYILIQRFLKESRQFGAQRRASETSACNAALQNLANMSGYADVNRMMWVLESQKLEELRGYMEDKELESVSVKMDFDEDGKPFLAMSKAGKPQKTLPKALAKNAYILELKEGIKELRDQHGRSRRSLENAMISGDAFLPQELRVMLDNPTLAPMLKRVVWCDDDSMGFLSKENDTLLLTDADGGQRNAENEIRPAHPHDFMQRNVWSRYQRYVFENQVIQPFKQVFREYYTLSADERQERTLSRRYAGHQVQPAKTVALLRGRGWTVDYDDGLQKVLYREDLIVRMFALADWFSPSDIESPTLETLRFFSRVTEETVPLEDVPPVIFSEVMRDIDLVVSVAHVGGVDPMASHSTVEMRVAIAKELSAMLKLSNVSFTDHHARIAGKLGTYSVHMGSGVVHKETSGMLSIMPVHSQFRGRLFLPFADEDPKTAEIMSKIMLLSEDNKIKDPTILEQLTR